ncbi:MAG: NADH-quinone oxidoreductase subunit NuoE [Candidatus Altiarchaeota archaeon]|nr:NADH-quinone oxidoreductase subunit NuoE [Candidatus Altiarchaeota archaeon]
MKSIDGILSKYRGRSDLIDILEDIQETFGYISGENMRLIEQRLKIPLVDVYGVVTFYSAFKLKPLGRHTIKICKGTACHVKKADLVQEWIEELLDIKEGETTADGRFTMECVNCIGACAKAPNIMIDEEVYGNLSKEKVGGIIRKFK